MLAVRRSGRLAAVVMATLTLAWPGFARAQDVPAATLPTIAAVLAQLAADPQTPHEYRANVNLHVRLRIFPFIRLTLHGNSSYKRPGIYHFVFRGVPKVAEKFNDLNYDLGDPTKWADRYDIAFAPQSTPGEPVVRLTPKAHGLVKSLDVTIDMAKGHMTKATWTRYDGGTIALVQTFTALSGQEIVAKQAATIDIPHMRADISADYADFVVGVVATTPER
ncbi:MAG: hypothetical protein NVSMB64_10970 [Candidatus Velthaea sp.]